MTCMSGAGVGAPAKIDARELSRIDPLDVSVGDPVIDERPANEPSLGKRRGRGEEIRSVRATGFEGDDSGADGAEYASRMMDGDGASTDTDGAGKATDEEEMKYGLGRAAVNETFDCF